MNRKRHLLLDRVRWSLTAFALSFTTSFAQASDRASVSLTAKLAILVDKYPESLVSATSTHVVTTDRSHLLVDDRLAKTSQEKLDAADIEDSLLQSYATGCPHRLPEKNDDPGRIRSQPLLDALYGNSRKTLEGTLVPVRWFGTTVRMTRLHGAAAALRRVRQRLEQDMHARAWLTPPAGTYNWRYIAGTKRRSMHSYGAAIDVHISKAQYWRWDRKTGRERFQPASFPAAIVSAFEAEGFIWGGRWFHYDSMHFEFRPELIEIGLRATQGGKRCE